LWATPVDNFRNALIAKNVIVAFTMYVPMHTTQIILNTYNIYAKYIDKILESIPKATTAAEQE